VATPRVMNRYPRSGERIAPSTLREFLMEPIPKQWQQEASSRLCDLDETAWDRFSPEALAELSKLVIDRVATYHVRNVLQDRHFPRPPKSLRLEDLRLENRTRRCLAREGFEEDLSKLGDSTISKVLSIRAFGPRCLVDLLSALESSRAGRGEGEDGPPGRTILSGELTAGAQRLSNLPGAKMARCDDPRFSRMIQAIDVEAKTAAELARQLLTRSHDPPDADYATKQVRQLADRIEGMSKLTIEEELIQIFGSTPYERNRKILIGYFGWEDGRQHTLTEIGTRFGITRERIRQVCAKLTKKHKNLEAIAAPVMDRALKLIARRLPCSAAKLEAEFSRKRLTAIDMQLEGVATGAKLLERPETFKIVKVDAGQSEDGRLAVRPDQVDATLAIVDLAKKEAYFHGLATVENVERAIVQKFPDCADRDLAVQTLKLIEGFTWLDQATGWFRLVPIAKHGLPKAIDKILAVAGKVTVSEMHTAMCRNRRLWKDPPPEHVLLEYCRRMPGVRVEGRRIISDPPRDWRKSLTGVEAQLVGVLEQHGPVMERGAMEDICVTAGMNRFSFHAFVSWSPVIAQFGHSVYGLLGTEVSQEQIDELIADRRTKRSSHRVLDSHGWTDDGKVWLSYRLSKAASTYAVITIPAALKKTVHGRFELVDVDGRKIGTLATKEGRAWGLGAFMREHGARIGDYVVVSLDLQMRTAVISLGEEPR